MASLGYDEQTTLLLRVPSEILKSHPTLEPVFDSYLQKID